MEKLPDSRQPLLPAAESLPERHSGQGGSSDIEEASALPAATAGTTLLQTTGNILNVFVGSGLLSMPYALHKGGWLALPVLAVLLPMFALSGQLIVWAFDLLPLRAPKTYPELGKAAAGRAGVQVVMFFSFLELFGGSIVVLMVAWRMAELLLPPGLGPLTALQLAASVVSLLLLPLLFVDVRKGLNRLSAAGLASCGLLTIMVLALLFLDPGRQGIPQQPPPGHHLASSGIIQAVGIFALSSTAHSTLPALRTAMQKPSQFPKAITAAFAAMLLLYSTLAACGYWYFGDAASALVTTDLVNASFYTGSRFPVHRILAAFVLLNMLCKFPALNLCLQDMILSVLPLNRDEHGNYHPPLTWAAYALRLGLFAAGTTLALSAYNVLGSVLSLLGGLGSISTSLLLPTAFYSRLAWLQLGAAPRAGLVALLALGGALVVLVTATNVCDISQRCSWHGGVHPAGA